MQKTETHTHTSWRDKNLHKHFIPHTHTPHHNRQTDNIKKANGREKYEASNNIMILSYSQNKLQLV